MKTFQKLYNSYGFRIVEVILALVILLFMLTVYGGIKQNQINEKLMEKYTELSAKK